MAVKCTEFQEHITELYEKYEGRFQWVGVAQSLWTNRDDVKEYQTRLKVPYPMGLDTGGRWFREFDIRNVPTVVILDPNGKVLSVIGDDVEQVDAALSNFK